MPKTTLLGSVGIQLQQGLGDMWVSLANPVNNVITAQVRLHLSGDFSGKSNQHVFGKQAPDSQTSNHLSVVDSNGHQGLRELENLGGFCIRSKVVGLVDNATGVNYLITLFLSWQQPLLNERNSNTKTEKGYTVLHPDYKKQGLDKSAVLAIRVRSETSQFLS